jgi:hypothetical protein
MAVSRPDISYSRSNVDFGRGFYTTPIKSQAINWSDRFMNKFGQSVVSIYEIDELNLRNNAFILEFDKYSTEWLDYIFLCRKGMKNDNFDVIIGGVANDRVFDTIQLFFDGLIDKTESLRRLSYKEPNLQYCFCSQAIIDKYLHFITGEVKLSSEIR